MVHWLFETEPAAPQGEASGQAHSGLLIVYQIEDIQWLRIGNVANSIAGEVLIRALTVLGIPDDGKNSE